MPSGMALVSRLTTHSLSASVSDLGLALWASCRNLLEQLSPLSRVSDLGELDSFSVPDRMTDSAALLERSQ
jgi:hypothetical protein